MAGVGVATGIVIIVRDAGIRIGPSAGCQAAVIVAPGAAGACDLASIDIGDERASRRHGNAGTDQDKSQKPAR